VACSLRVATKDDDDVDIDAESRWEVNTAEDEPEEVDSDRAADEAAILAEEAVATAVRGEAARRAGRERAKDRLAAMMNEEG
jgi:hypothetical protein